MATYSLASGLPCGYIVSWGRLSLTTGPTLGAVLLFGWFSCYGDNNNNNNNNSSYNNNMILTSNKACVAAGNPLRVILLDKHESYKNISMNSQLIYNASEERERESR